MKINLISNYPNAIERSLDRTVFDFATTRAANSSMRFHRSLPGYQPTPLVKLNALASRLGLREMLIKDESYRFGLNAFKVLGASYAMAKYLGKHLGIEDADLTFENITRKRFEYKHITFVTATDGNHGRAVAWASQKFGCKSVVYLPKGSSEARLKAIQSSGADASITDLNYDDTVLYAEKMGNKNDWVLLQDTSWEGYEEIPRHIMQGYFTLLSEYILQEPEIWPTHIFIQAGVGSLAGGLLAYLYSIAKRPLPLYCVVEPEEAPCLYDSMRINGGEPYRVPGNLPTIMAGLACGEPSHIGLNVLKSQASSFLICSDDVSKKGMRIYGNPLQGDPAMISGESGAVTLGAVFEIMTNEGLQKVRDELNLSGDSTILLVSTEGDTDPDFYRKVVWL